jgi:hypothetical protein
VNASVAQQNVSNAHLLQCVLVVMITSIYFSKENAIKNLHVKFLGQWVKMNILQLANLALKIVIHAKRTLENAHLVNLGFIYLRITLVWNVLIIVFYVTTPLHVIFVLQDIMLIIILVRSFLKRKK